MVVMGVMADRLKRRFVSTHTRPNDRPEHAPPSPPHPLPSTNAAFENAKRYLTSIHASHLLPSTDLSGSDGTVHEIGADLVGQQRDIGFVQVACANATCSKRGEICPSVWRRLGVKDV